MDTTPSERDSMNSWDIQSIRSEFPQLATQVNGKAFVYLDSGATTLKPRSVSEAVARHYAFETSNVHRGVHHYSQLATIKFEESRRLIQAFLGANKPEEIIFTKGTTEGINLLSHSLEEQLKPGDEILLTMLEHHSNIVPWQMLAERKKLKIKVLPINQDGTLKLEELPKLLTDKTKIFSFIHTSNALGNISPVKKLIQAAKANGTLTIIDAAQAVAHEQIDVKDLDCDFLVFSGHKLFGPTGVGVLYGKESLLEKMPPYQGGGDMIHQVSFEKTTYADLPSKFEAGTPPIASVLGLGKAIEFMNSLDWTALKNYEEELSQYGLSKLSAISQLKLYGEIQNKKVPVFSFNLADIHPYDVGSFTDQKGIAMRIGHHCTQPLMDFLNVPATVRASLSLYNTKEEIDHLAQTLEETLSFF